jgi:hypothetical protein
MTEAVETLILDLLEWVANRERTYEETMDAWRTSCPRLSVWEDANERGLIATNYVNGREIVRNTSLGVALLHEQRPSCPALEGRDPLFFGGPSSKEARPAR